MVPRDAAQRSKKDILMVALLSYDWFSVLNGAAMYVGGR